jgi:hypothetical protein
VGHVILAVVIWFLAFQGVLWALVQERAGSGSGPSTTAWVGFGSAALGTAIVMISAFAGRGDPVLANYIPVLTHPAFETGMLLFAAGMGLSAVRTLRVIFRGIDRPVSSIRSIPFVEFGAGISASLVLLSLLCFALAGLKTPGGDPGSASIDRLVWGGGHVLQFANTAAMVMVWLMLARLTFGDKKLPGILDDPWAGRLLTVYPIAALPAPFFYLSDAPERYFTVLMAVGLGPVAGTVAIALARAVWSSRPTDRSPAPNVPLSPWSDPGFAGLILSLALFGLGGLIALGIRGSNVIIPAHYHAVIGAVTIAFMGFSYRLLPLLGRKVWSSGLARVQPYFYGAGQTLFVLGLFWAGLHGVARKTFGPAQTLHDWPQIVGMSLMGLGGLVAISGGIAFVANMVPSLLSGKAKVSVPDAEVRRLVFKL